MSESYNTMDSLDTLDAMVNPAQHESVTDHQFDEFQHRVTGEKRGFKEISVVFCIGFLLT